MACSMGAMGAGVHSSAALVGGCSSPSGLGVKHSSLWAANGGRWSSLHRSFLSVAARSKSNSQRRDVALLVRAGPCIGRNSMPLRSLEFDPFEDAIAATASGATSFSSSSAKFGWVLPEVRRRSRVSRGLISSAAAEGDAGAVVESEGGGGLLSLKSLTTGSFFFAWYFLNVVFNILNKKIYNYFPYPYFVSVIHLVVGVAYCAVSWGLGLPKRAPIDKGLWQLLAPVSFCHALGHVMTNVSFAAVAVSFTHTIKSLEPFFNAAASQFILGQQIPLTLWLSLAPIVLGVSAASLTELSFNWRGFISAMTANVAFTYRNIYSKKAMTGMDSTNVYAYISILSLLFCIPPALIVEGPTLLNHGFADAVAKVGIQKFVLDLFWVGIFYHLYNQLANNTLERVAPLTHAVGNVLKRVFVIGFSIIVFGNKISTQTGIGTAVAIAGVAVYSIIKADIEEKRRAALKSAETSSS